MTGHHPPSLWPWIARPWVQVVVCSKGRAPGGPLRYLRPAVVLPVLPCLAFLAGTRVGFPRAAAAAEAPGEVSLVGEDLSPWRGPTGEWFIAGGAKMDPATPRRIATSEGTGVLVNGPSGRTSNLLSRAEFGDCEAHIEFLVPEGSNSGVYFQGRYEIQILDSWGVPAEKLKHGDCGGIYQRWKDGRGFEGHAPRVNASRPPGRWQSFDVVFRAPRFDAQGKKVANARFIKVVHNGVVIHENVEVTGPTRAATFSDEAPRGPLMLQGDHGPVAYRNIRIRPRD